MLYLIVAHEVNLSVSVPIVYFIVYTHTGLMSMLKFPSHQMSSFARWKHINYSLRFVGEGQAKPEWTSTPLTYDVCIATDALQIL